MRDGYGRTAIRLLVEEGVSLSIVSRKQIVEIVSSVNNMSDPAAILLFWKMLNY